MILDSDHLQKIKEEQRRLRSAVRERMVGYVLAALGFVAGLAWNDAIKSTIEAIFPVSSNGILAKFIYAAIVTVGVAVFAYYISKFLMPKKE